MENVILSELCSALDTNVLDLDLQSSFIQNGGHSIAAAALASRCEAQGYCLTTKSILTSGSIKQCVNSARPIAVETVKATVGTSIKHNGDTSLEKLIESPAGLMSEQCVALRQDPTIQASQVNPPELQFDSASDSSSESDSSNLEAKIESNSVSSESSPAEQDEPNSALTDMQLSLIHGTLKTRGMNIISYSETYFTKDVLKMKKAWKAIIDLEPIFRIAAFSDFSPTGHQGFQWHEQTSFFNDEQTRKAIDNLRNTSEIESAFHVFPQKVESGKDPLSTITWIVHHAFVDGFSASLLLDKVRKITAGIVVKPSPRFSQYADDLQKLRKAKRSGGNEFWLGKKDLLNLASSQLMLPAVTSSSTQSPCDEVVIDIRSLGAGLKSFSKEANVTPATLFNVAWALTLSKYCDSLSVKFGVILSGRDLPLDGVEEIIGPLMNTLPFCVTIDPTSSTKSFARAMMETATELREFQWTTQENGFHTDFESAMAVQFDLLEPPTGSIKPVGGRSVQPVGIL